MQDNCGCNEPIYVTPISLTPAPSRQLHIRWLIRRDMAEVVAIERDSFPDPWPEHEFISALRERNCIGLVVEHSERVIGFMLYELTRQHLRIINMAVHPGFRRARVGTALIAKLKGKLSPQRRNKIILEIRESNIPACHFFAAQQFKTAGIIRNYYKGTSDDAYKFVFQHPAG